MVLIDARPDGLSVVFRRGTARNVPLQWPVGTLAGRTFTATLDAVPLTVNVTGDLLTVSITVAQTLAADVGPLLFELVETTGVDQPILIGTWFASDRPSAVTPDQVLTVTQNTDTVAVQIIGGTNLPELAAADPTEVDLATAGGVTTLTLLDTIARKADVHRSGQYYFNVYGTSSNQTIVLDQLCLYPVRLSAGTIDQIGFHVVTPQVSAVCRLGVYADDGGLPLARIAEAATTADASTAGSKPLSITAPIPKNGLYWLAFVAQGAAGVVIRGGKIDQSASARRRAEIRAARGWRQVPAVQREDPLPKARKAA